MLTTFTDELRVFPIPPLRSTIGDKKERLQPKVVKVYETVRPAVGWSYKDSPGVSYEMSWREQHLFFFLTAREKTCNYWRVCNKFKNVYQASINPSHTVWCWVKGTGLKVLFQLKLTFSVQVLCHQRSNMNVAHGSLGKQKLSQHPCNKRRRADVTWGLISR